MKFCSSRNVIPLQIFQFNGHFPQIIPHLNRFRVFFLKNGSFFTLMLKDCTHYFD